MSALSPYSAVTGRYPDMVQTNFETAIHPKPSIALNHILEYAPDHITFKLVPATQTNANHFVLIFSVLRFLKPAKSLPGKSSTR